MEKLASVSIRAVAYVLIVLFVSSCAKIKFIAVQNDTNKDLSIRASFINEYGENDLVFPLKPGESDLWQYEVYPWTTSSLQESFKKFQVSGEGCDFEYDRKAIEEKAKKTHVWNMVIDAEACGN